ncbi:MAG TPA: hypothetical protein VEK79_23350 [Thermoanaerobaculia bacterium]|nr:hypothetical protein [Thermoanaerobaculia bacterium]
MRTLLAIVVSATLAAGLALPALAREGFGFKKKAVEMMRTIPPSTNAGARRVKINVTSDRSDSRDDAQTLNRYIGEAILGGAGTLADSGRPEVTVDVSLDRVDSHETYDTETEYVRQQTGTKRKWNEDKKKYEDEPIYSSVPVQKTYKVLTANVSGRYDIAARNDDVASGSIDQQFREKYSDGESSRAPSDVEDELMRKAARAIAANLVPTQERVSVLLPRSTFEQFIPLAESGNWDRYLAAVEAVAPNRNPKDEAYRQYAIACAKEALAYANEDRKEALEMLREARKLYDMAVQMNGTEELFRKGYVSLLASSSIGVPQSRINDSLAKYETWTSPSSTRIASKDDEPAFEPEPELDEPATGDGMRNSTVIELAKAGLSDENIKLAIDGADRTAFDVSPEGLIALAKGGVSKGVIAHMQKKKVKKK